MFNDFNDLKPSETIVQRIYSKKFNESIFFKKQFKGLVEESDIVLSKSENKKFIPNPMTEYCFSDSKILYKNNNDTIIVYSVGGGSQIPIGLKTNFIIIKEKVDFKEFIKLQKGKKRLGLQEI